MLGNLIGKIVAAPLYIATIPAKVVDFCTMDTEGPGSVAGPVEDAAEAVDGAVSDAVDSVTDFFGP